MFFIISHALLIFKSRLLAKTDASGDNSFAKYLSKCLTSSFFTIPSALAIFALSAMTAMVNPTVFSGGDFNF